MGLVDNIKAVFSKKNEKPLNFEEQVKARRDTASVQTAPVFTAPIQTLNNKPEKRPVERPKVKDEVVQKMKEEDRLNDIHNALKATQTLSSPFSSNYTSYGAVGGKIALENLPKVDPSQSISNISGSSTGVSDSIRSAFVQNG